MADLKTCPFCGRPVKLTKYVSPIKMFYCQNESCGAVVSFNNDLCNFEKGTENKIRCWNRRVNTSDQ